MQLYSVDCDFVINGYFITGRVTYQYALDHLVGLIDKLDIQRKFQNETYYKRLEFDFQGGCITPAITIAFINDVDLHSPPSIEMLNSLIEDTINSGFILDGIQRLNTLKRVFDTSGNSLDVNRYLYVNIIICPSRDNLLYRMVTLNNGQRPMTARHQIEILAENIYDFNSYGFSVLTEKESAIQKGARAFKKADLLNAYISFLSDSTSLDNKKIIEDKLDELVARRIIERKITDNSVDFERILRLIERMHESEILFNWLKNGNNMIGFAVGLRTSFALVNAVPTQELEILITTFEKAFKNLNVSKIKVSRERRNLSAYFISHIDELRETEAVDLTLIFAEQI
jgi:hypothetical protein